jgi:hypothetical protein
MGTRGSFRGGTADPTDVSSPALNSRKRSTLSRLGICSGLGLVAILAFACSTPTPPSFQVADRESTGPIPDARADPARRPRTH